MANGSQARPYRSPFHFRPGDARMADTIPFYWDGEYHIFYLKALDHVPWEHVVSRDLVTWKELPTALHVDGPPDSVDGGHMFTGSVLADKQGGFHIFYTGHNDANPRGNEFVCHAVSADLVKWTKVPADTFGPDGELYKDTVQRDFRDPYVFWNEGEACWWMVFFANDARTGAPVQGLAVSSDLVKWEFQPPLKGAPGQECPDLFEIDGTWYLLGADTYRWAPDPRGPYREAPSPVIDRPFIYAAKRMFDGRRHVWTGWLWDRSPATDAGEPQWGGTQCWPRELTAGPGGQLYSRPVPEPEAAFKRTVIGPCDRPIPVRRRPAWRRVDMALEVAQPSCRSQTAFDVPADYLLDCTLQAGPDAEITIAVRERRFPATGYWLTLRPAANEAEVRGPGFHHTRRVDLDPGQPFRVRASVVGSMVEWFIDERYGFSVRGYDCRAGRLGFNVSGGTLRLTALTVRALE